MSSGGAARDRQIAFLGLGQMGRVLAENLTQGGYRVVCYDPSPTARATAGAGGLIVEQTVPLALSAASVVCICVPGPTELRSVLEEWSREPFDVEWVVNLSTCGPDAAAWAESLTRGRGRKYLESPVTGGVLTTGRRNGAILCASNPAEELDSILPVIRAMAPHVVVFSTVREASVAKLVNNVAAIGNTLSTLEALELGLRAGLELEQLFRVLDRGTARSYVLSSTLRRALVEGDRRTGFSMLLAYKDLRIAQDLAESLDWSLSVAAMAATELSEAIEAGFGDHVFPALVANDRWEYLKRVARVERKAS